MQGAAAAGRVNTHQHPALLCGDTSGADDAADADGRAVLPSYGFTDATSGAATRQRRQGQGQRWSSDLPMQTKPAIWGRTATRSHNFAALTKRGGGVGGCQLFPAATAAAWELSEA